MTVRFGMNSSSDAESSARRNAKHESSSSEGGLSWRMRLIAQAEATRLAPTDGGRYKRLFRTLKHTSTWHLVQKLGRMVQGCVHQLDRVAGMTRLRSEARLEHCVARVVMCGPGTAAWVQWQVSPSRLGNVGAGPIVMFTCLYRRCLDVVAMPCVLAPKRGCCWLLAALSRPMAGHQFGGVPEAPDSLLERGPLAVTDNGW
ncbi:hypothetical protein F5883DRAFT_569235 [Diaporthe sp. PMI_573]|nr:hypothetical protein F5883DRAFT_569235 [Diaporthaceae sp. PMI_573]